MCGRFNLRTSNAELNRFFDLYFSPEFSQRYNIAPTQSILGIRVDKEGHRVASWLKWGLIPSWAKTDKDGAKLINARSDGVAEKPSFRSAFKRRRCLIPASYGDNDGPTMVFYEAIRDFWNSVSPTERSTWFDADSDGAGVWDADFEFMKDSTSANEALHRFFGLHDNGTDILADFGIMTVAMTTPFSEFVITDEQFRALQNKEYPK